MKLSNALGPLDGIWFNITTALPPTLKAVLRNPTLLLSPSKISQVYMSNLWMVYADGIDGNAKSDKETLITPHAHGVVLDLGAGHGHTVRYLNRERVTKYIALEPNSLMHPHIRAQANNAGYHEADGTLVILSHGAQETQAILSALALALPIELQNAPQPIDTIVSALTLCTVPDPERTVMNMVRDILKPGGQFLMYEHVLSTRPDVAWWQHFWAPLWALGFDGCRMDRASDILLRDLKLKNENGEVSAWQEASMYKEEGTEEQQFFLHAVGRFTKL
ncbi:hypothetical protein BDN70DRAFT_882821 [Pholiota conissans]|uniref:S-adenosyl-L-methionine-dependent methyltransferase n=1 Tax=Pholiota conissans TaxID=109636 RepID=A0A9P5YUQ5_9AGAR|nr:hypothetical protein BDN70DRAFT_882821 [Pholiota conissans]